MWRVPFCYVFSLLRLIRQALRHTALSVQMFYILLLVTTYTILLSISGATLQHSTFIQGLTEWWGRPALLLVSGRHWTKRHYRKKCPIFILVIGFIVLGLRRTLHHNFTARLAWLTPCPADRQYRFNNQEEAKPCATCLCLAERPANVGLCPQAAAFVLWMRRFKN